MLYFCSGNSATGPLKYNSVMIKYKKYKNKNLKSVAYGKWFGRAVRELMEFDEFIEHMAKHHCVFSEATIRGVLIEMEICLREQLLEGKAVRLDDLGIFALGLETRGETSSEKFTADSIKAVHMNLYLGKRFRARNLFADAKFKEADKYIGDGNYFEPDGDTESASTDDEMPGPNAGTEVTSTGGNTRSNASSDTVTQTGASDNGSQSASGDGAQGEPGDYRLVIFKYGSGTSTVTDQNGQELNSNDNVASGTTVNISVVPADGKVPTANYNGSNAIALTEHDGVYTGSFVMPTRGTSLEINSEPGEDFGY